MSEGKKSFSGVKIVQQPGGDSHYSISWGHQEEPVNLPADRNGCDPGPVTNKNPETFESSSQKVV